MAGRVSILGGEVVVVMNPAEIKAFLGNPGGPVVRDMLVRGERVRVRAIELAPKKTGNLAAHIIKRIVNFNGNPAVIVGVNGSQVPYAYFVHEGTEPHPITGNPLLVFFWPGPKGPGKVVAFPSVNHPGTKPNRFLLRALSAAAG